MTASRVAYFDLLAMPAYPGSVPASNTLACPDDIFGKRNGRDLLRKRILLAD